MIRGYLLDLGKALGFRALAISQYVNHTTVQEPDDLSLERDLIRSDFENENTVLVWIILNKGARGLVTLCLRMMRRVLAWAHVLAHILGDLS
jgi:hypothetical protein